MGKEMISKSILLAIFFGIFGWVIGSLLAATAIFPIANLSDIGLFLGLIFGGFKEYLTE